MIFVKKYERNSKEAQPSRYILERVFMFDNDKQKK